MRAGPKGRFTSCHSAAVQHPGPRDGQELLSRHRRLHRRASGRVSAAFGLAWKRAPAHTAIRYVLKGLDLAAMAGAFRRHARCAAPPKNTSRPARKPVLP